MQDLSQFDPDSFLSATTQESSITQIPPVKEGEYGGYVKPGSMKLDFVGQNRKPVLNLLWVIDDEQARQDTKLPEPTVKQTIWLEQRSDGTIDLKGTPGIGRLREAHGLNVPGQDYNIRMHEGKRAKVQVKHDPMQDDGTIYAKVVKVAKP